MKPKREMARLAYQMVANENTLLNLAGRFDGDLASYNSTLPEQASQVLGAGRG